MMAELKLQVPVQDIATAIQNIYGENASVLDYEISPASSNIQGFSSSILRVKVTVKVSPDDNSTVQVGLIAKCIPVVENESDKQLDTIERFRRELEYFNKAVPILQEKCENLPIVKCYFARPGLIIMEDLNDLGYVTLSKNMKEVGKILLEYSHVKLVMQKLAELNAASVDVNWIEKIELLKRDNFFIADPSPNSFYTMCVQAFQSAADVLSEYYPESRKNICPWLTSSKSFDTLIKYSKASINSINILAHGDFWINNIMFKLDVTTNLPLDVKFIDFQLCRYVHPTRDILHVMYTCLDKSFRDNYEKEMLEVYVETFNEAVEGKSNSLSLQDFRTEYEESRLFGALLAVVLRSLNLMSDIYPDEGEDLTQERLESVMCGDQYVTMTERFRTSPEFNAGVREILEEFIDIMEKNNIK